MLRSILVGVDAEAHHESVTELAIRWSARLGARVVGLGIVDEPGIRAVEPAWAVGGKPGRDPILYEGYDARLVDVHREVDWLLGGLSERCAASHVECQQLKRVGSPAGIIEREAQVVDVVLLPQRSHFRFAARGGDPDDTVKQVLKNAPRPLVVVPAKPVGDGPVVVAYDGSRQAARAVAAFEATGLAQSGQVHLVCAAAPGDDGGERATRARDFLAVHGIDAEVEVLTSNGAPAPVLLERVRSLGASLLVMGAYGRSVLREVVIGSVTRTILDACPVPVMAYH
jgi:nucleotide-binding universal stress UspA family protein